MQQRVQFCGVDVGSQNLKVVCLLTPASPGQPVEAVTAVGAAPGPWAERCVDAPALGQALAELCQGLDCRFGRTPAAVSMPTGALVVKTVTLPAIIPSERQAAFRLELDRLFPLAPGEAVCDWLPLFMRPDSEPGSAKEGYLLLAAHQQAVSAVPCALGAAKMRPVAVEPEPAALYRLAHMLAAPEGEAAEVLVDLGAGGTRLLVLQHGELLLFRDLPVGGSHLTDALAHHLQVEPAEAEELKRTKYQVGADIDLFGDAGERLLREVERSLRYIERGFGLEGYGALHLVGGGANWPFLRRLVEVAVGIRAQEQVMLLDRAVDPAMAQATALALWQERSRQTSLSPWGSLSRIWDAVRGGLNR